MKITEIGRALRRQWWAALGVFCLGLAAAGAGAVLPVDKFASTATVLVQPAGADYTSISAVQFVLPSLAAEVQSQSLLDAARGGLPLRQANAPATVKAQAQAGTGVLRITVSSPDRTVVAPLANALTEALAGTQQNKVLAVVSLDPARPPTKASNPRVPVAASGGVLAAILSMFAAVGVNAVRSRGNYGVELPARAGAPVIGEIPRLRRRHNAVLATGALSSRRTDPRVYEAYQRLRTSLEISFVSGHPESIAVTSVGVGEGKSTVVANLASAMALVGHTVVVIDADLRRPTLHRLFDCPIGPGVSDVPRVDIGRVVRTTPLPRLRFVAAGVPVRHPAEHVSTSLPTLLDAVAAPARTVFVDTPPLSGLAETLTIAAATKHVLLVVDGRRPDLEAVERAVAQVRGTGAEVLGLVINRARARRSQQVVDSYYLLPSHRRGGKPRRRRAIEPPSAPPRTRSPVPAEQDRVPAPSESSLGLG